MSVSNEMHAQPHTRMQEGSAPPPRPLPQPQARRALTAPLRPVVGLLHCFSEDRKIKLSSKLIHG